MFNFYKNRNIIDNKSWNVFVKEGTITEKTISKIATTIKTGKKLSMREIAIYQEHSRLIEMKLNEFKGGKNCV